MAKRSYQTEQIRVHWKHRQQHLGGAWRSVFIPLQLAFARLGWPPI